MLVLLPVSCHYDLEFERDLLRIVKSQRICKHEQLNIVTLLSFMAEVTTFGLLVALKWWFNFPSKVCLNV